MAKTKINLEQIDGLIDPDNPVAQSPAQLIGGNNVVLQNFIDLANGANNGKFTANIDGVEYEDLSINLGTIYNTEKTSSQKQNSAETNEASNYYQGDTTERCGQTFLNTDLDGLKKITIQITNAEVVHQRTFTIKIRAGAGMSGEVLATKSLDVSGNTSLALLEFVLDTTLQLTRGQKYTITMTGSAPTCRFYYSTTSLYSESAWYEGNELTDRDFYFVLKGYSILETEIATAIQTAIRAETGEDEIVAYNTDHFEITSTISGKNNGSSVLKLTAPTTGTDISGAGYLDLGANATEVPGDGDDYKLVRLDENGLILSNKISLPIIPETQANALDTVYQNTSKKSIIVYVTVQLLGGNTVNEYAKVSVIIGATSSPNTTILVAQEKPVGTNSIQHEQIYGLTFIVPPNYYYKVLKTVDGGTATLISWFEAEV